MPVTVWQEFSGAVALRVGDRSIREIGRIEHAEDGDEPGTTDCRKLSIDDLATDDRGEFSTELEHLIAEDYSGVLACERNESGMTGFSCHDEAYFNEEADDLGLLRRGESISICWPDDQPNVIVRSIVIGDELWTLGNKGWGYDANQQSRLEVNDLHTLARLARIDL